MLRALAEEAARAAAAMASARAGLGAAAEDDEDDMDSNHDDAYEYAECEALLEELYSPSESDLHIHGKFSWILFSHVCVSNSVPEG